MRYTICNRRPVVLHIPDAWLRLDPGQTVTVDTLTPQIGVLIQAQALELVARVSPSPAPTPKPVNKPGHDGKRGGRSGATPTPPVVEEHTDDAQ